MSQSIPQEHSFVPEKIGFFIVVVLATLLNNHQFVYDEPYHLGNVELLKQYGLTNEYLHALNGPAGPTYAIVHFLFSPITQLKLIPVRLVNPLLFIVAIWLLNRTFVNLNQKRVAWLGMAIPMTATCLGMALTELPSVFFLILSIYLLTKSGNPQSDLLYKLLSGVALSIAIIGRQPLLLVLPFLALMNGLSRAKLKGTIIFLLASLAIPLYCFYVWGNIIAPRGAVEGVSGGVVMIHFLFALGYCMFSMLLIAPRFLELSGIIRPWMLVVGSLIVFLISIITKHEFAILNTLAERVLPAAIHKYYPSLGFALVVSAGLYFILVLFVRLYEHRHDKFFSYSLISCAAILFSALSINHQFSSRYVFQAYPFMVIMAQPYLTHSKVNLGTRAFGVLLGIGSLVTYVFAK
jgi:hypothetical protein